MHFLFPVCLSAHRLCNVMWHCWKWLLLFLVRLSSVELKSIFIYRESIGRLKEPTHTSPQNAEEVKATSLIWERNYCDVIVLGEPSYMVHVCVCVWCVGEITSRNFDRFAKLYKAVYSFSCYLLGTRCVVMSSIFLHTVLSVLLVSRYYWSLKFTLPGWPLNFHCNYHNFNCRLSA